FHAQTSATAPHTTIAERTFLASRRIRGWRSASLFGINPRSHHHLACYARHELRQRGEFFAVAFCQLVPEVGVGRYDLIAGAALGETLKEGEVLLVLTTYEALP